MSGVSFRPFELRVIMRGTTRRMRVKTQQANKWFRAGKVMVPFLKHEVLQGPSKTTRVVGLCGDGDVVHARRCGEGAQARWEGWHAFSGSRSLEGV